MGAVLLGNLYPVPPPPYSALPYLYTGLLWGGFAWSMIRSNRAAAPEIAGIEPLPNETD
jgi:uncharacterized membrane protein